MVQEGPTVDTVLWLGWPGGQFLEKQWQEEHLALLIFVMLILGYTQGLATTWESTQLF